MSTSLRTLESGNGATPARGVAVVPALFGLVRFVHTLFALPFALAGALLARHEWPRAATLAWILVAMVGARSLAMALNRLVDREIDARNPRTAARELPAGRLTVTQVRVFSATSLAALLLAVSQLAEPTWYLWPIPVALFVAYPYAKRFTWVCHAVLGVTIGLAPVGAWIAVTGDVDAGAVLLGIGVAAWIAGFDIIYALLDTEFDRTHGVHSFPATFGARRALTATRVLHACAVAALLAAALAVRAGWALFAAILLSALVLVAENLVVRADRPRRINVAFGHANIALSVIFALGVILEVTLN